MLSKTATFNLCCSLPTGQSRGAICVAHFFHKAGCLVVRRRILVQFVVHCASSAWVLKLAFMEIVPYGKTPNFVATVLLSWSKSKGQGIFYVGGSHCKSMVQMCCITSQDVHALLALRCRRKVHYATSLSSECAKFSFSLHALSFPFCTDGINNTCCISGTKFSCINDC